jgi:HEAT repeat protein
MDGSMPLSYPSLVVAGSFGAFVVLVVLLFSKRLGRNRAERVQAARIAALSALVGGPACKRPSIGVLLSLADARSSELMRIDRVLRGLDHEELAAVRTVVRELRLDRALKRRLVAEARDRRAARRATGALLLGRLRISGAAPVLADLLDDPDPDVAQAACRALGLLADDEGARVLITALEHRRVPVERIIESLLDRSAVPALVARLEHHGADTVRRHAIRTLGLIGDSAAEEALLAVTAVDDEEQIAVCRALATAGTDDCLGYLRAMLAHDSWPVRAQAATALGSLTPTVPVVSALEDVLSDPSWWVRANAAAALARLGGHGIAGLLRATRHPDRYARARAEEALALLALGGAGAA